jgi:hypothetical protein
MQNSISDTIAAARQSLVDARDRLGAEIAAYPSPVSGCDAQFNHLIAERKRVARALNVLDQPVFVPTPRTPTQFAGVESR